MMGNFHTRLMLAFPLLLLLSPIAHADLSPGGTYRRLTSDGRGLGDAETGFWILSRISDQVIVVLRPGAGWPEGPGRGSRAQSFPP